MKGREKKETGWVSEWVSEWVVNFSFHPEMIFIHTPLVWNRLKGKLWWDKKQRLIRLFLIFFFLLLSISGLRSGHEGDTDAVTLALLLRGEFRARLRYWLADIIGQYRYLHICCPICAHLVLFFCIMQKKILSEVYCCRALMSFEQQSFLLICKVAFLHNIHKVFWFTTLEKSVQKMCVYVHKCICINATFVPLTLYIYFASVPKVQYLSRST